VTLISERGMPIKKIEKNFALNELKSGTESDFNAEHVSSLRRKPHRLDGWNLWAVSDTRQVASKRTANLKTAVSKRNDRLPGLATKAG